jgi:hypothetical protein
MINAKVKKTDLINENAGSLFPFHAIPVCHVSARSFSASVLFFLFAVNKEISVFRFRLLLFQ